MIIKTPQIPNVPPHTFNSQVPCLANHKTTIRIVIRYMYIVPHDIVQLQPLYKIQTMYVLQILIT